ncbi:hypothetical protein STEG23_028702, partial [Scotinomys teguina]
MLLNKEKLDILCKNEQTDYSNDGIAFSTGRVPKHKKEGNRMALPYAPSLDLEDISEHSNKIG